MSDDNSSRNVWGWLILSAVVAILGVGFLYQREGERYFGRETPTERPTRTRTGSIG
jgi:hypothetical protein